VRWLLVLSLGLAVPAVASADGAGFDPGVLADRELTFELAAEQPGYRFYVFSKTRAVGDSDRPLLPLHPGAPVTVSGQERRAPRWYKVAEAEVVAIPTAILEELRGEPPTEDWLQKRDKFKSGILISPPQPLTRRTPLYNPRRGLTAHYRTELTSGKVQLNEIENDERDWWKGGGAIASGFAIATGFLATLGAFILGMWLMRRAASRRANPNPDRDNKLHRR
jgi:hypothetical protein